MPDAVLSTSLLGLDTLMLVTIVDATVTTNSPKTTQSTQENKPIDMEHRLYDVLSELCDLLNGDKWIKK